MANPYIENEEAMSMAKSERINKRLADAGSMLNVLRLSPIVQLPGKVLGIIEGVQYFAGSAGIKVGNSLRGLWGGEQVAPLINPSAVTVSSSFSLSSLAGWTSLLIAGGGAIEVANDLRHHEFKKAARAAIVTSSTVATVIEESVLIASLGALPIFALEAGSLMLTGKGIGQHIGNFIADLFLDDKKPVPATPVLIAPYGVPLQQQVIPPTVHVMATPDLAKGNVAQVLPATGQVATAVLSPTPDVAQTNVAAPESSIANGWQARMVAGGHGPDKRPIAATPRDPSFVNQLAASPSSPSVPSPSI